MKFLKVYRVYISFFVLMIGAGVLTAIAYSKITAKSNRLPVDTFDVQIVSDKPFPDTELTSLDSNLNLNESIHQGDVLLVYMETGCAGCKIEADLLAASHLYETFGIKVYIVGYEGSEDWAKFSQDHQINFPVFYDKSHVLRKKLGVNSFPHNFFLRDGKIERTWRGVATNETVDDLLYKKLGLTRNAGGAA